MKIKEEIENLKKLSSIDKELIIHRIYDAWQAFNNKEANEPDKFALGLRYYEFLANRSTDEDFIGAERRRLIYLGKLGLTHNYVKTTLNEIYGLT